MRRSGVDPAFKKMIAEGQRARNLSSLYSDQERALDQHRLKVELMVRTLWECLMEIGVTREDVERKMDEISKRGWAINPNGYYRICPQCGKKVFDYTEQAFEAACLYCGTTVPMYPGDMEE